MRVSSFNILLFIAWLTWFKLLEFQQSLQNLSFTSKLSLIFWSRIIVDPILAGNSIDVHHKFLLQSDRGQASFEEAGKRGDQWSHSQHSQVHAFRIINGFWSLLQWFQDSNGFVDFQGFLDDQVEESDDWKQIVWWDRSQVCFVQIQVRQVE